ncbi:ATP-binding cassette sub-family G member 4-like, partial [Asbolus verrucosus]
WNQILHSVSGKFISGELTAILGPSGAGKSTLLNVLAGYVSSNVQGCIKVNGFSRNTTVLKKMSSYIMQDNIIQPHLTVKEAMFYAVDFKLGTQIKYEDKSAVNRKTVYLLFQVEEVIDLLGLEKCVDNYSEHLSGGERRRLCIALELVNNPPIIFLDEPTTGLDDSAVKQCIDLLKKISNLNRTVVLTIHQPQASLFQIFDQVYIMADGCCVYNGSPSQLVSFFSHVGYSCPSNYTPAEYIIELIHSNRSIINNFKSAIENGKINWKHSVEKDTHSKIFNDETIIQKSDTDFPTSFLVQFFLILSRRVLQMKRNRTSFYIQIFHHLLSAFLIIGIFTGIGNNDIKKITIVSFLVPLEVNLLKREHFNRWYGLKAYFSAVIFTTLPALIFLSITYSGIVYFLTDQPKDADRFIGFSLICVSIALTSQGLGYFIGSLFNVTSGSVVASLSMAPLLVFSYYGIGSKSNSDFFKKILTAVTYMRGGIIGLSSALFYKREPLICHEDVVYCHYARVDTFMKDMSIPNTDYKYQLGHILIFMMLFHLMAYLSLKFRLDGELSS